MVIPGGDAHSRDQPQHQDDQAEDDQAGGGVGGDPLLSVLQRAHGGGHAEILVISLQQKVLEEDVQM